MHGVAHRAGIIARVVVVDVPVVEGESVGAQGGIQLIEKGRRQIRYGVHVEQLAIEVGVEGGVHAIHQVHAEGHAPELIGRTEADQLDVFLEDPVVFTDLLGGIAGAGKRHRLGGGDSVIEYRVGCDDSGQSLGVGKLAEIHNPVQALGELVVIVDVVKAQVPTTVFQVVVDSGSPLARIISLLLAHLHQARPGSDRLQRLWINQARYQGDELVVEVYPFRLAMIGVRKGQTVFLELQRIVAHQAEVLVELKRAGNLGGGPEQFLCLGPRYGEGLVSVESRHAAGNAVYRAGKQQAVAPVNGVAAGPDTGAHAIVEGEVREHESVEQLTAQVMLILAVVREFSRRRGYRSKCVGIHALTGSQVFIVSGVRIVPGIGVVVPGRGAHAQAEIVLPDYVQLREDVDAVIDHVPLLPAQVRIIAQQGKCAALPGDFLVEVFCADLDVVLERVIPPYRQVLVVSIELEGVNCAVAAGQCGDRTGDDRASHLGEPPGGRLSWSYHVVHFYLHVFACCVRRESGSLALCASSPSPTGGEQRKLWWRRVAEYLDLTTMFFQSATKTPQCNSRGSCSIASTSPAPYVISPIYVALYQVV